MNRIAARGFLFVVAFASLLGGSLLGFTGAGSRASAQEPALVLFGTVTSGAAPLPTRVRATIGDVACGSALVSPTGEGVGFYAMIVVSEDTKPGCGVFGSVVSVRLQSGEIDPGAGTRLVLFRSDATIRLDLSTSAPMLVGSFEGKLPDGSGEAYVRWTGASATPIEEALRTVPRTVRAVFFWDMHRQEQRQYVVGADASAQTYTLVDTDDIVLLRVQ